MVLVGDAHLSVLWGVGLNRARYYGIRQRVWHSQPRPRIIRNSIRNPRSARYIRVLRPRPRIICIDIRNILMSRVRMWPRCAGAVFPRGTEEFTKYGAGWESKIALW